MTRSVQAFATDTHVVVIGEMSTQERDQVREKMTAALRHAAEPVLFTRVRITRHRDPAVARPFVAQANVDLNGRPVRVQVAAATATEAIDTLAGRVRSRLDRLDRRMRRPDASKVERPHPAPGREIVRHKAYTLVRCPLAQAVFELDLMGYDFHLFTEEDSGQDSVVYRAGPTGYRLARLRGGATTPVDTDVPVTVSRHDAAVLRIAQAVERLSLSGAPFLFFADAETGRGQVLYSRYDGNLGLITPAA